MSLLTFAVVIFAAALHAAWNAQVKNASDKYVSMSAVVVGHFPFALIALLASPLPAKSSWIFVGVGAALHIGYQFFLLLSYRAGDLSHVYPIARGIAPLLVAGVSVVAFDEHLDMLSIVAILAIGAGIISLVFVRSDQGLHNRHAGLMAIITGCFIAGYSLVDGYGARAAGTALGFFGWLSVINSIVFVGIVSVKRPDTLSRVVRECPHIAILGGGASFLAYSLVVWAFTQAPIALVTALRETSIIFAMLIGVFFLRERLSIGKVFSTALTLCGAVLLRVSR